MTLDTQQETILYFATENDVNGNPRRIYCAFDQCGQLTNGWDEGYEGYAAVPLHLQDKASKLSKIEIDAKTYRSFLKKVKQIAALNKKI